MSQEHPLFTAYPLGEDVHISIGTMPTPYLTYDGYGLLIGGTADLDGVRRLLEGENVHPMATAAGRAIMGIWVVNFTDANLGPHHELQFSFLVAHEPVPLVEDHPLALTRALFVNPKARMFCYGLWNSTEKVVAYNREVLGLNARLSQGTINNSGQQVTFSLANDAGDTLFEGQVSRAKRTPLAVGWSLMRLLGLRQTVRALSEPYLSAKVVNPIGDVFPYNGDAQTYLAADTPVTQFYDAQTDSIRFGMVDAAALNFDPQFLEHFQPFRFVYLQPERP